MLTLLLPLWIVEHTHAPRWSVSVVVLLNTILVTLFQVRVGRNVKTVQNGGTALRRAGVIFLVSCSAIGLATGLPGWAALFLLVAAVMLHTLSEMWRAVGSFALAFGLAPAHAQGQYQGLAGIGAGIGAGWRRCCCSGWSWSRAGRLRRARGFPRPARPGRPRDSPLGRAHPASRARGSAAE